LKLGDHCGPFQPRPFYDSMNLSENISNFQVTLIPFTLLHYLLNQFWIIILFYYDKYFKNALAHK